VQISLTAEVSAGAAVAYARNAGMRELPATEASLAATWLKGRRQYRNEPLRYVLADIDRYTGKQIVIVGESTGDLQFTGTLDLANSATWLKGPRPCSDDHRERTRPVVRAGALEGAPARSPAGARSTAGPTAASPMQARKACPPIPTETSRVQN
jgi:hypothetical protein